MIPLITIRRATDCDGEAVRALLIAAFAPSRYEERLGRLLWRRGKISSHFVACDGDTIVGYVAYTWAAAKGGTFLGLHLAPLAVLPERQGQGIGSRLVTATLNEAAGSEPIFALGEPAWFRRFGFVIDRSQRSVFDPGGDRFQVRASRHLEPCDVEYEPEFADALEG
jgi:putative acetyltransferase